MKRLRVSGNALQASKLSGTVEDYWLIQDFNYSPSFDSLGRTLMLAKVYEMARAAPLRTLSVS